jgi:hypothetical protein
MELRLIHLIFAVLAVIRLTEMFTVDKITEPLRKSFSWYIWTCPRCLSVWAGIFCAIGFFFAPWVNWPLAFSYLYFVHNDFVYGKRRAKEGRQLVLRIGEDGVGSVIRNELAPQETIQLLRSLEKT